MVYYKINIIALFIFKCTHHLYDMYLYHKISNTCNFFIVIYFKCRFFSNEYLHTKKYINKQ